MNLSGFIFNLLVCFLLSFCIGLERQVRRRFIGLRTLILVAVGSYLFVSFTFLLGGVDMDKTRIAAQVVAGIGFLGAGVIIKDDTHNKITGLTTAATLWCDASIGILCAGGFVLEACVASIVVLFSNIVLRHINSYINNKLQGNIITEGFDFEFNCSDSNIVVDYINNYISKNTFIKITSINVDNNLIRLSANVKKNDISKVIKFVNLVVSDNNIKKYKYENVSETRSENEEEEL